MTVADILLKIIQFILSFLAVLGIIGFVPLVGTGIYFFSKVSSEQDLVKKAHYKKKGLLFVLLPFIMLGVALIFQVIISLIGTLTAGDI